MYCHCVYVYNQWFNPVSALATGIMCYRCHYENRLHTGAANGYPGCGISFDAQSIPVEDYYYNRSQPCPFCYKAQQDDFGVCTFINIYIHTSISIASISFTGRMKFIPR